jgi:hypothetical protein
MTSRALLSDDDYFHVFADDATRIIRLVRTPKSFPSAEAIQHTFAAVQRSLIGVPPDWSLLIDVRDGPLRNDPEFEDFLGRVRGAIVARFAQTGVLVKSAVGRLQVERYAREDHRSPQVFRDEADAVAHLTGSRKR